MAARQDRDEGLLFRCRARHSPRRVAEIFNTDQACPSSPDESIGLLQAHDLGISIGGRGPWRGKVFVDRLWKTVKDEEVFLKACGGACFVALASAIRNAA
ncbi:hypothetical protein [Accumulibacter sp.]|uniref:hypothetical protein n=1 Tax=Accumulibacter sp. TaxID=2053492 RepID=UPI0026360EA3|nr:hypothetical protein [Accumulibacter sp.]